MNKPAFLPVEISLEAYVKWVKSQARRHFKRDNVRWGRRHTLKKYQEAIYEAIERSQGFDAYTGGTLDWHLIGLYRAGHKRAAYKKMPTVDHDFGRDGDIRFEICSWTVNDCKSDLSLSEWMELMSAVMAHAGTRNCGPAQNGGEGAPC